ncbi:MAG: hypothetical protein GF363_08150 [Chitinivibrionales bacterium]|nr:hypothetical protein [Chitinivibrionales bacterium]
MGITRCMTGPSIRMTINEDRLCVAVDNAPQMCYNSSCTKSFSVWSHDRFRANHSAKEAAMNSGATRERRRHERTKLVTFCPVRFIHDGEERQGFMRDLSTHGAGFVIEHSENELRLKNGEILAYTVKTPYGEGGCKVRTMWARAVDGRYLWGGEFVEISGNSRDPLRALMDSPF